MLTRRRTSSIAMTSSSSAGIPSSMRSCRGRATSDVRLLLLRALPPLSLLPPLHPIGRTFLPLLPTDPILTNMSRGGAGEKHLVDTQHPARETWADTRRITALARISWKTLARRFRKRENKKAGHARTDDCSCAHSPPHGRGCVATVRAAAAYRTCTEYTPPHGRGCVATLRASTASLSGRHYICDRPVADSRKRNIIIVLCVFVVAVTSRKSNAKKNKCRKFLHLRSV